MTGCDRKFDLQLLSQCCSDVNLFLTAAGKYRLHSMASLVTVLYMQIPCLNFTRKCNNNNNNERISRAPFHVKHAQLR